MKKFLLFLLLMSMAMASTASGAVFGQTNYTDDSYGVLQTLLYGDSLINSGRAFFAVGDTTVATLDTLIVGIATTSSTTRWPTLGVKVIAVDTLTVSLYEDATFTGGYTMTALNRNRNSANASTVTITHTPVATANGTLLSSWIVPPGVQIGDYIGKLKLDDGSKYLLRILPWASDILTFQAEWTEPADRSKP